MLEYEISDDIVSVLTFLPSRAGQAFIHSFIPWKFLRSFFLRLNNNLTMLSPISSLML